MIFKRRKFTIQDMLWLLLLLTCIGALYSDLIVMVLFVVVIYNAFYNMQLESSLIGKGILLIINYLPFYTIIRVSFIYLGYGTVFGLLNYFRDFIIIVLLISCLRRKKLQLYKTDSVWILFVMNWIIGIILAMISGYGMLGILGIHLTVIPMFLYYVIAYDNFEINVEVVIKQFLKIAMIITIVGLWAYYRRPGIYCQLFTAAGNKVAAANYVRFVSIFFTPNVCGCFLAIAIIIALVQFIYEKKIFYFLMMGIFTYCLALTLSRGAWAFALFSVFILLCFIKPKFGIPFLTITGLGIFLIYIIGSCALSKENIILNIIKERMITIFDLSNTSSYGRISTGLGYVKLLLSNPLGFGLGVSTTAQVSYGTLSGVGVIDGFYLKSIIETGIIGIIYIVVFVFWVVYRSFSSYLINKSKIGIIALLLSVGFLMQSLGSNTFDFVCTAPFIWIFLGLSVKEKMKCKIDFSM